MLPSIILYNTEKLFKFMKKKSNAATAADRSEMPLGQRNYILIAAGVVIMILGFILLSGGASQSPEVFNYEMFNFRRLYIAPTLLLAGLALEVFAILYRPKDKAK